MGYTTEPENVTEWHDALKGFYTEPARWSFLLQCRILADMAQQYARMKQSTNTIIFVERSPSSALVFVRNSVDSHHLTPCEKESYDRLHALLAWKPDLTIYINTPVEMCATRIEERDRTSERSMSTEYLSKIEHLYHNSDLYTHVIDGTLSTEILAVLAVKKATAYMPTNYAFINRIITTITSWKR